MSSDWKDTNSVWQDTNDQNENLGELLALEDQQDQVVLPPNTDPLSQDEENPEESELFLTKTERAWGLLRQISPVLAPLLFGGITFLFILPFVLNGRSYLPASGLLPIGLILLAIAVLHGIILYYAGADDTPWSLSMAGGFLLFLLAGCFALFGPIASLIVFAVMLVLSFLVMRFCIHSIPEGQVHIIQAFGNHSRTLFPGLHFLAPWEHVQHQLDTRETAWTCPTQKVLVSRTEEIHLAASISYQLLPEDAHLAALYVKDWDKSLQESFVTTVQNIVGELTPEDFIAWPQVPPPRDAINRVPTGMSEGARSSGRWEYINNCLAERMQDLVAHWGVQINWVQVRDITLVPHILTTANIHTPTIVQTADTKAAGATAAAQPSQTQTQPKKVEPEKTTPSAANSSNAAQISKTKVLTDAYQAIRTERITDPITIRNIAARFEAIAKDPEASKTVEFDAARAALILQERAKTIEERTFTNTSTEQTTEKQPDWSTRRPSDDNLMAGG